MEATNNPIDNTTRLNERVVLRLITPADDVPLAQVIRLILEEYQAIGAGYAHGDAKLDAMYAYHSVPRSGYWVLEYDGQIRGGSGFGPAPSAGVEVCELRRMYLSRDLRGLGLGRRLLELTLSSARAAGYRTCYLETLQRMHEAIRLYETYGFQRIAAPLNDVGCAKSDAWFIRKL